MSAPFKSVHREGLAMTISSKYVRITYAGDSRCKRMSSSQLREGMVVLVADPRLRFRENPRDLASVHNQQITSRWCAVTSLSTRRDVVSFIPVYHDGPLERRFYDQHIEWFVKKTTT